MNRIAKNRITIMAAAGVLCVIIALCGAADRQVGDYWKTKENITRRLSAEWHKTLMLDKELAAAGDVLSTLQDFEYYPQEVTGIADEELAGFDRGIEELQKRNRVIKTDVEALKAPVVDALKILREMVIDEPVESMFETLESGNLGRIDQMLNVKHSIDTLWRQVDSLISGVYSHIGLDEKKVQGQGGIEDEFFELLKANMGMQSQKYYDRISKLRMHAIAKAQPAERQLIERVDMQRIKKYLDENNDGLAEKRIVDALHCHMESSVFVSELYSLLVGIHLRGGAFEDALAVEKRIPNNKQFGRIRIITRVQSNFALKRYEEVLADTAAIELLSLKGEDLNHALWVIMESAITLKMPDVALHYAGFADKTAPRGLYVIHSLARAFIASGDDSTALAVVQQGAAMKPLGRDDEKALQELSFMKAELLFEQKRYSEASSLFFRHLNTPDMFERALSGIAWCYIKKGEFEKAEITLRKLINQSPESVAGVEGIAILAKRNMQAAGRSWKKYAAVEREKKRLVELRGKLDRAAIGEVSEEKRKELERAREHLAVLNDRVHSEPLDNYTTISAYYQNTEKLCRFINDHYYTGTFQEVSFSMGRERVLGIIDSVLAVIASPVHQPAFKAKTTPRLEKAHIKQISDDASLLSVITQLNRYQWEMEYVEWRKRVINLQAQRSGKNSGAALDSRGDAATKASIDSLIAFEQEVDKYYSEMLIRNIGRLLATPLREPDRCYLEYQMAELMYKKENAEYTEKYEVYEKSGLASPGEKAGAVDVSPPSLDHSSSMKHYRAALGSSADSLFAGGALYGLGWCYNDIGEFDSAYAFMKRLAETYPENPHTPQAWMYCGEYNFDKGQLDSALASFYRVMKYPESEWFDDALYKVAWTQYRLSNPEKAISSFLALVELGQGELGRALLEKESMDYVAISFSEIDIAGQNGLRRAAAFVKKLGDSKRGCEILHRLAQVYKEQGRYDIALKTYELILSTYPDYEKNPQVEAERILVQDRDAPVASSLEQKYDYFRKYNRTSSWAAKQQDSIKMAADSVAARMLYDVAVSYHQMALQDKNGASYTNATNAYRDYITMYKKLPLANECHYNLAEIQFSLGNYPDAAVEFMAVSREYPDSKYRETAAWNAIVAAQYILKQETAGTDKGK